MPIKFHCPTATCGKALTVSDEAAGRTGKCPNCGNILVVPRAQSVVDDGAYDLAAEPEPRAQAAPAREPAPAPRPTLAAARPPVPPPPRVPPSPPLARAADPDWNSLGGKDSAGPVVSFDVVGLAWGLLKSKMGTWVLAVIAVSVAQVLSQLAVWFASILAAVAEFTVIGNPFPLSPVAIVFAGMMVQMVLFGGLYRMALKQVDGGDIQVSDAFAFGQAPGLALAGLLMSLGTGLGFFFLIIPGLVLAALLMFTLPAVVDGLGAVEAIKRSVGTLKRQWILATVFLLVMGLIMASGALLLWFGLLITLPLYVLAGTVQYRRSFARGGVPRKAVVADPWAEAVGAPPAAAGSRGVPAWAWGVLGAGVVVPVVMVAAVGALAVSAARQMAANGDMQRPMAGVPDQAKQEAMLREMFAAPPGPAPGGRPAMDPPRPVEPARGQEKTDPMREALDVIKKGGNQRVFGIGALARIRVEDRQRAEVVAALGPLLQDPELGGGAAEALARWAGPAEVPLLITGLSSKQPGARTHLMRALGRLKAEEAIPALAEHLAVPEDRGEAARALQRIGPNAAPEVQKILTGIPDDDTRRAAGNLLRQITRGNPNAMRAVALANLTSPDTGEREGALRMLEREPADDDARGEVLAVVVPLLQDREVSVRRGAARVLVVCGTDEERPALVAVLSDPDRETKRLAMNALGRLTPDPPTALGLAQLLTDPEGRAQAVVVLKQMKVRDKEVEAEVRKALGNDNPSAREAACQVLEVIGTAASVPALKRAASDRQQNVARAAREALTTITTPAKVRANARKKR